MINIQKELLEMKRRLSLSTSDLAVLLDINRSTIMSWENGVTPHYSKRQQIEKKIEAVKKVSGKFPIPLNVTQYQRKSYLLDALNGRNSKLSQSGTSARR